MYLKKVTNFLNYYYHYFIFQLDPCIGRDGEVSHYNLNYNLDFRTTLSPGSLSLTTRLDFHKFCGMSSKILHFPCQQPQPPPQPPIKLWLNLPTGEPLIATS